VTIPIVALIAAENVSGPARQLSQLAVAMPHLGYRLHVLLTSRTGFSPPLSAHLSGLGVPHQVIMDRGPLDWRTVRATGEYCAAVGAALLQTHGYKATAIGAALRGRASGGPWVGFYHGGTRKGAKDLLYQGVEFRLLRKADRIVVVAESQMASFSGCEDRLRVMPNAVLPMKTLPRTAPRPDGAPLIGVIGRLSYEKGLDVFLTACSLLRAAGHHFAVAVAGDGPEAARLRERAGALGLDGTVTFLGHVEDPATLYPTLDLVVVPSRSEGMPNVILEAMGADLPVVATAVGAVPAMLAEPHAGTLVEPGSPEALAAGILGALRDGRSAVAAAARRRVAHRYSLETRARLHAELYHELLTGREVRSA
jgi:glycosyltransferase involved in cell wall biosynthesis